MSRPSECWVATQSEPLGALLDRLGARAALEEGRVFVAARRANDPDQVVAPGNKVEVYPRREIESEVRVLFEKDGLLFVDKPAGIATEPERRGKDSCLLHRVAMALGVREQCIHALSRLDLGVSGVVVLGLDPQACQRATQLKQRGQHERRYLAIAAGLADPPHGVWQEAIGHRRGSQKREVLASGEPAETQYSVFARAPGPPEASALVFRPRTGRTHQLRVHAAVHGVPLFGDRTYGGPDRLVRSDGRVFGVDRVLLHAVAVQLGEFPVVESQLPALFAELWQVLGGDGEALTRASCDAFTIVPSTPRTAS